MAAYKHPITLEAALKEVTEECFCKGHHYKDVALTDAMVEQIVQVKSLVNMGFINTDITDEALTLGYFAQAKTPYYPKRPYLED